MEPSLPFLDCALADEFFIAETDKDKAELRAITDALHVDLPPRLEWLRAQIAANEPAARAQAELHQVRGVLANFGLKAAAELLRELEVQWPGLPPADKKEGLQAAEAAMQAGLKILEERFPYLRR